MLKFILRFEFKAGCITFARICMYVSILCKTRFQSSRLSSIAYMKVFDRKSRMIFNERLPHLVLWVDNRSGYFFVCFLGLENDQFLIVNSENGEIGNM